MAAAAFAPFSHSHFQSLPTIDEAREKFLVQGKGEEIIEKLREFFLEAQMDRIFGVAMLHRHFDLNPDEKLIEYHGTVSPWIPIDGMKEPRAAMWGFDDQGLLRPTEFQYSNQNDADLPNVTVFIHNFRTILEELGLRGQVGLARYPGDDFPGSCEITQGRTNVNLKPGDYPTDEKFGPTVWYFSAPLWTRGCRCLCPESGGAHKGHSSHVITT